MEPREAVGWKVGCWEGPLNGSVNDAYFVLCFMQVYGKFMLGKWHQSRMYGSLISYEGFAGAAGVRSNLLYFLAAVVSFEF